jgi:protein gp37
VSQQTGIQWTEATWNPWHGCHKVSPGCDNCYMFTEKKMYGQDGDKVVRSKTKFNDPLKWVRSGKPPKMCFTCSWSDFFISEADPWREEAWNIIRKTPGIVYQILTKRAGRIRSCLPPDWGMGYPNVWLGVSVEGQRQRQRLSTLRGIPAITRFVSFEPLIDYMDWVDLGGIDWAIVGGESGPNARPMDPRWARGILTCCIEQGCSFFMKQMGGKQNKRGDLSDIPPDLRIRQYPAEPVTARR